MCACAYMNVQTCVVYMLVDAVGSAWCRSCRCRCRTAAQERVRLCVHECAYVCGVHVRACVPKQARTSSVRGIRNVFSVEAAFTFINAPLLWKQITHPTPTASGTRVCLVLCRSYTKHIQLCLSHFLVVDHAPLVSSTPRVPHPLCGPFHGRRQPGPASRCTYPQFTLRAHTVTHTQ